MREGLLSVWWFPSKKKTVMEFHTIWIFQWEYTLEGRNETAWNGDHQVTGNVPLCPWFFSGLRFMLGLGMQSIQMDKQSFRDSCPSCHCSVQMCLQDSTTAHPWNTSLCNPLTILIPVAILTHMVVSCWTSQRAAVGGSSTSPMFSWFFPVLQPCLEMTPANDANA